MATKTKAKKTKKQMLILKKEVRRLYTCNRCGEEIFFDEEGWDGWPVHCPGCDETSFELAEW